jgi:hypothetical protein
MEREIWTKFESNSRRIFQKFYEYMTHGNKRATSEPKQIKEEIKWAT